MVLKKYLGSIRSLIEYNEICLWSVVSHHCSSAHRGPLLHCSSGITPETDMKIVPFVKVPLKELKTSCCLYYLALSFNFLSNWDITIKNLSEANSSHLNTMNFYRVIIILGFHIGFYTFKINHLMQLSTSLKKMEEGKSMTEFKLKKKN